MKKSNDQEREKQGQKISLRKMLRLKKIIFCFSEENILPADGQLQERFPKHNFLYQQEQQTEGEESCLPAEKKSTQPVHTFLFQPEQTYIFYNHQKK